jgi:plasmid maintenance system killer protein
MLISKAMEVEFADPSLDRLEVDGSYTHRLPAPVVSAYRMCLQLVRAATNEGDLMSMRMLGLTRLDNSSTAYSIKLADGYQLSVDLRMRSRGSCVCIRGVEHLAAAPSEGQQHERQSSS